MSRHFTREAIEQQALVVAQPREGTVVDRTFGLPGRLYVGTVAFYLGFLGIMAMGLSTPGLIIPMAIFALFIVAGFAVPAIWTRMSPIHSSRALSWGRFRQDGIMTATGRVAAGDVSVQVLILPALIFLWGAIVVTIVALS